MIVLIGESGPGKTTILNELEKIGYNKMLDYTTRPKREKEEQNNEYVFVTKEEFERLWSQGKLLQRAEYNGEFYGISAENVSESSCCIQIVDSIPDMREGLKRLGKDLVKMKVFYIHVPAEERTKRMLKRGDSIEAIQERLRMDKEKFKEVEKVADVVIENVDLQKAVNDILTQYAE